MKKALSRGKNEEYKACKEAFENKKSILLNLSKSLKNA